MKWGSWGLGRVGLGGVGIKECSGIELSGVLRIESN